MLEFFDDISEFALKYPFVAFIVVFVFFHFIIFWIRNASKRKEINDIYDSKIRLEHELESLRKDPAFTKFSKCSSDLIAVSKELSKCKTALMGRDETITQLRAEVDFLNQANHERIGSYISTIMRWKINHSLPSPQRKLFINSFITERGEKALSEHFIFSDVSCTLNTDSGHQYQTSFFSCDCPDFQNRHRVCKHMLALAVQMEAFPFREAEMPLLEKLDKLRSECSALESTNDSLKKSNNNLREQVRDLESFASHIKSDLNLSFPWLAGEYEKLCNKKDSIRLFELIDRKSIKSADQVREIKREKKQLVEKLKMLQNQMAAYEYLFPWLEEFKTVPLEDALESVGVSSDSEDFQTKMKNWLSPEEYSKLSYSDRLELALKRYNSRHKTDWDVGIEYERYVGYLYEQQGFRVQYFGATQGMQDLGRDILATKGNLTYVVQCKRWSEEKTIHEKHIFQLFGTTFILRLQNPDIEYVPVFYTTAHLSDTAQKCSAGLHIDVHEGVKMQEYPLIKCNIGKDDHGLPVKIYHLPFDQQYDSIIIEPEKGEFYTFTVEEAESKGFRHAMRHSA